MKHLDDGDEFRLRFSTQRPVPRKSGLLRYRTHSTRPGNRADGDGDSRCVFGFECFIELGGDHLGTVEIFGCIERLCFGHISPEPTREFIRALLEVGIRSVCATRSFCQREAFAPMDSGRRFRDLPDTPIGKWPITACSAAPPPAAPASVRSSPVAPTSSGARATSRSFRRTRGPR